MTRAATAVRPRRLAVTGAAATAAAVAATTLAAALARAAGVDFEVSGESEAIPLGGVAVLTGLCSVAGVTLAAAVLRWSSRPAELWVRLALSLTALSLVPPVLVGADAPTVVALIGLHLVAAAVVIPAVAHVLRGSASGR